MRSVFVAPARSSLRAVLCRRRRTSPPSLTALSAVAGMADGSKEEARVR